MFVKRQRIYLTYLVENADMEQEIQQNRTLRFVEAVFICRTIFLRQ